ncbi:hypothetical protein [Microcoleus sp. FACHB-672]|uniref:hypothetical protein n=1 Tax=Microcoleus sp. FACHB-672 TaxID=2692825 RepID=UPI001683D045|nr:hypothetical protein [Microcoleus sp. FACHB-672]MBD2039712.1 hypothetical protein [Microcoleus sp. FACHB-672]
MDLLPSMATYYRTDVGSLFWRRSDIGYPDEFVDMTRREIAARLIILTTRAVDDVTYTLFMRLPAADVATAGNA